MNKLQEIEVEAKSLEEARGLLESKIPEGFYCFSENVLSDGKPYKRRGVRKTVAEAFDWAHKKSPNKAEILEKKVVVEPGERFLEVEGFDEISARKLAEKQIPEGASVDSMEIGLQGSKGFLGIRRRPNKYMARIIQLAVVEIYYKRLARIRVGIKERLPSAMEFLDSLGKLEKETTQLWLKLDKPVSLGEVEAVMLLTGLFKYLKEKVSNHFNAILTETKRIFTENTDIRRVDSLNLGPPNRNFDVSDIPLVSKQFKEAVINMRKLKELMITECENVL